MITRLRIQNYKSLRNVDLDLRPRNVLVGPNMSGKSNLLDVFRLLRDMVAPEPGMAGVSHAFNRRLGFSEVAWKGSAPTTISISLVASFGGETDDALLGAPDTWNYSVSFSANPSGSAIIHDERLTFGIGPERRDIIKTHEGRRLMQSLDGRNVSQADDRTRSALEFEIPEWDGDKVRSEILRWRFHDLAPRDMRRPNTTAAAHALAETGENISAWLMTLQTRYRRDYDRFADALRSVFPEIREVVAWTTEQATVFLSSQEKLLQRPTSIWQMSDGQLCFMALLSILFAPDDLGAPLYCIEEPEKHLHPKLIETLVRLMDQRQDELGQRRAAQMVATTHSPHLIDHLQLDDLIVVERKEAATVCTRPSGKPHLRELLEREEAGLGDLYYSGSLSSG